MDSESDSQVAVLRDKFGAAIIDAAIGVLKEGGARSEVVRLSGLKKWVVASLCELTSDAGFKKSPVYEHISIYAEGRLREAIEKKLTLDQAANYSGASPHLVRGFFRKVGYCYLSEEQIGRVEKAIEGGACVTQIERYAGITRLDRVDIMATKGLELRKYNPQNPLANPDFWRKDAVRRMST